jgi:hypothetical protein
MSKLNTQKIRKGLEIASGSNATKLLYTAVQTMVFRPSVLSIPVDCEESAAVGKSRQPPRKTFSLKPPVDLAYRLHNDVHLSIVPTIRARYLTFGERIYLSKSSLRRFCASRHAVPTYTVMHLNHCVEIQRKTTNFASRCAHCCDGGEPSSARL